MDCVTTDKTEKSVSNLQIKEGYPEISVNEFFTFSGSSDGIKEDTIKMFLKLAVKDVNQKVINLKTIDDDYYKSAVYTNAKIQLHKEYIDYSTTNEIDIEVKEKALKILQQDYTKYLGNLKGNHNYLLIRKI